MIGAAIRHSRHSLAIHCRIDRGRAASPEYIGFLRPSIQRTAGILAAPEPCAPVAAPGSTGNVPVQLSGYYGPRCGFRPLIFVTFCAPADLDRRAESGVLAAAGGCAARTASTADPASTPGWRPGSICHNRSELPASARWNSPIRRESIRRPGRVHTAASS